MCCSSDKKIILKEITEINNSVVDGVWLNGSGVPSDTLGVDTNFYIDTDTNEYYQKDAGTWGTPIGNLTGATGPAGADGADGANGADGADGAPGVVQSIVAGTNVTVDATDPANPIVSAAGGGGGQVDSVIAGSNITVDNTDPVNPIVNSPNEIWGTTDISGLITDSLNINTINDTFSGEVIHCDIRNSYIIRLVAEHNFEHVGNQFNSGSNYTVNLTTIYSASANTVDTSYYTVGWCRLIDTTGGGIVLENSPAYISNSGNIANIKVTSLSTTLIPANNYKIEFWFDTTLKTT
jgi:hypothetical protein